MSFRQMHWLLMAIGLPCVGLGYLISIFWLIGAVICFSSFIFGLLSFIKF